MFSLGELEKSFFFKKKQTNQGHESSRVSDLTIVPLAPWHWILLVLPRHIPDSLFLLFLVCLMPFVARVKCLSSEMTLKSDIHFSISAVLGSAHRTIPCNTGTFTFSVAFFSKLTSWKRIPTILLFVLLVVKIAKTSFRQHQRGEIVGSSGL